MIATQVNNSRNRQHSTALGLLFPAMLCFLTCSLPTRAFSQEGSQTLTDLFRLANKAFTQGDFETAKTAYQQLSLQCSGSELGLQSEYFAALSDWNLKPCQAHADAMLLWLERSKEFENRLAKNQSALVSKSWEHWVESAHLIVAKWDISQGKRDNAKWRLKLLSSEENRRTLADRDATMANVSWPKTPCESPWVLADMADVLAMDSGELDEAQRYYDRAAKVCGDDENLNIRVSIGKAIVFRKQSKWQDALNSLDRLSTIDLPKELELQAKLLRVQARKRLEQTALTGREIQPLVDLALSSNPKASLLYELALILLEEGLHNESEEIFSAIVHRFPKSEVSVEARLRLAYRLARAADWKQVKQLTEDALQIGCQASSYDYACYLNARSLLETGDIDKGITAYDAMLSNPAVSEEFQIRVRLDLAEYHYRNQSWRSLKPILDWLAQKTDAETKTTRLLDDKKVVSQILLWRSELLANQQRWDEAEKLVSTLRSDFSAWDRLPEVDYLLARCRIAKTDFDSARTILQSLVDGAKEHGVSPTLAARSAWMIGETYMMQHRYTEAKQAYELVSNFPSETYWLAASVLQQGLCAEQLKDFQDASRCYERVIASHSETPFAETARTRQSVIRTSAKQIERIGSGTKR